MYCIKLHEYSTLPINDVQIPFGNAPYAPCGRCVQGRALQGERAERGEHPLPSGRGREGAVAEVPVHPDGHSDLGKHGERV